MGRDMRKTKEDGNDFNEVKIIARKAVAFRGLQNSGVCRGL